MQVIACGRSSLGLGLVLLALVGSPPALAGESADLDAARAAFKEASGLAEQKQWSAACERYEQSLKLYHAPLTLYSLGVAQREAGRLVQARASFQSFLAEPTTAKTEPFQEPARAALTELRNRIGTLNLTLAPAPVAAATVTIDGVAVAADSLTTRRPIDPGPHKIAARAPGRAESSIQITMPEGGTATVTLTLARLVPGSAADIQSRAATTPVVEDSGSRWPRPLPYALLGVGIAALGTGVAVGMVGVSEAQSATSAVGPGADGARTKGIAGDVLIGTGIATAGIGLILLLLQRSNPTLAGASASVQGDHANLSLRF